RTQFFSAPAQAALLALALGLVCRCFPATAGRALLALGVGLLASNATMAALQSQEQVAAAADVRFEKTVHVFQQIHALVPHFDRDRLIVLVLDDGSPTPLGPNYAVLWLARVVLGMPALQVNYADPLASYLNPNFTRQGLAVVAPQKST